MLAAKPAANQPLVRKRKLIFALSNLLDAHGSVREGAEANSTYTDDAQLFDTFIANSDISSDAEVDTVRQFYNDILRLGGVICPVVDHFFKHQTDPVIHKSDYWLFVAISYILLFYAPGKLSLDSCLGWVKSTCTSEKCTAVSRFVRFVLDEKRLCGELVDMLSERYERKYVTKDTEKAAKSQFSIVKKPALSERTRKKMDEIVETENAKLDFDRHKSSTVPANLKQAKQIKLNTAAILREDAAMRRRDEDRLRELSMAEVQLHDTSEYEKWKATMRAKQIEEERTEQERKRLEVQLLHEEALISKEETLRDKQKAALEVKAEKEQLKAIVEEERKMDDEEKKKKVDEVQLIKERAQEAKKSVVEENQKIVASLQAESERLLQIAREEAEEEARRRAELIRQIRELESVPISRFKEVDLAETSGTGLLNEMSIVELQERLEMARQKEAEEEEERRQAILRQKQDKEDMLREKLAAIQKYKRAPGAARSTTSLGQAAAAVAVQEQQQHQQDRRLDELRRQLEERKRDRAKISAANVASPRKFKFKIKPSDKGDRGHPNKAPISHSVPNLAEVKQWKTVSAEGVTILKARLPKANSAPNVKSSRLDNGATRLDAGKTTSLTERLKEITGVDILM
ncbi:hypothetical protein RI367_000377 [Sorochytrium milnesiophthora]